MAIYFPSLMIARLRSDSNVTDADPQSDWLKFVIILGAAGQILHVMYVWP